MPHKLTFRQLLLSFLALWQDLSHKEIGAAAGLPPKRVSQLLRRGELRGETFERLRAALRCPPAAVRIVAGCLEALEALEKTVDLTPEELAEIEEGALTAARLTRESLAAAVRLSRTLPEGDYPAAGDLPHARRRAEELWGRLVDLPEETRLAVVHVAGEFQSWALCERVCAESVTEASRNLERSAALARLAGEIAARVPGPEGWRLCLQGYAAAHRANVLRVSGDLKASDAAFESAKRLWQAGSDPDAVLDPGRLLDLEASLRRDQSRFDEALSLLDKALSVGRSPARVLVKKASTLEAMEEYQNAVGVLLQALPLVESLDDRRLLNILRCNLAFNCCQVGRFAEADELARRVCDAATEMGDEIGIFRVTWIKGRIAAGRGRPEEARRLLAQVRREFGVRGMSYDVALALLEEAVLLLDEDQTAEVKALARELAQVFESKGVHREALAALRLFQKAAEREEATADLARRILTYLFRAHHDHGLRFEP